MPDCMLKTMTGFCAGNAKTLMYVNISPADYNVEETLTSLAYAARVKLITNDAAKVRFREQVGAVFGLMILAVLG